MLVSRSSRTSALLLGFALMCGLPATGNAAPILDQSQIHPNVANRLHCGGIDFVCGQTFTAGITGTLTSVDFWVMGADGPLQAALYTNLTADAPPAMISPTALVYNLDGWYTFDFALPVTAGMTLFFGLQGSAESRVTLTLAAGGLYQGGVAAFRLPGNNVELVSFGDTAFRTFVEPAQTPVPEPASLALLGFGLAGIGVRRWRQRKAS